MSASAFKHNNGSDKKDRSSKTSQGSKKRKREESDESDCEDDEEDFRLPRKLQRISWLDYITLDSTVTIFGKRNTGKSFYARYLLYQLRDHLVWGWVMTNTPQNGWWQTMIPEKRIFKGWQPDVIRKIMELQRERFRRTDINPYVFIILDDIVSDERLRYDPILRELYFEGRHFGIFILICSQYVYGLPPGNRANTDFMITFTQHQRKQIQQLQEDYCSEFKNWRTLRNNMDQILGDFECLIVDQRDPNLRGHERYFKDKATEVEDFYIGTKQYWDGCDWEEQLKKWAPIKNRTLEEMKKKKSEMEWKEGIDDSGFFTNKQETPLLDRIMDYGGLIPNYYF